MQSLKHDVAAENISGPEDRNKSPQKAVSVLWQTIVIKKHINKRLDCT